MMKLRLFSKNSAKSALLPSLALSICLIVGCSSSTKPSYLKENIAQSIQDICKKEYRIELTATLTGSTLWIYVPVEDILAPADKPEKYIEKFSVTENKSAFRDGSFSLQYQIETIPEKEKIQQFTYDKAVMEKFGNVWKVLRRVLFSLDRSKNDEPKFFCIVIADIKNGLELKETFYYLDLKKVSYQFISWTEYQHRDIQGLEMAPQVIGDKEGRYLECRDISLGEFIADQIRHRVRLKFERPEVEKNALIDKEIIKIAENTMRIYGFKEFSNVEFNNLVTNSKIVLNQAAILTGPSDWKP